MNRQLRVLMIEDTPADFLLLKRHLRQQGVEADCSRVDSQPALEQVLANGVWDILLSDYNVPGMDIEAVLIDVIARFPDLPIIMVSGTIGEAKAVDMLKTGVADFVLKDDLGRLVPSLHRALREVISRRELRLEQRRQRHLVENISHGILLADGDGVIFMTNPALDRMFGYLQGELLGQKVEVLVGNDTRGVHVKLREEYMDHPTPRFLWSRGLLQGRRQDGSHFPIELSLNPFQDEDRTYIQANVNDVTERTQAERDLRIAATVFEVQEGVLVTDRYNRILRVNQAFSKITGYSEAEVIGKDPRFLKSGLEEPEFYRDMWRILLRDKHWAGELRDRHKDGYVYPKWLNISAVTDDEGEITHFVGVFSDLTHVKQAEQAVAANVAKSKFLANMSHELRTPMNGVVGMTDILQETSLTQEQRRMVRTIRDSSLALLGILDEILDFSKIEAGKLILESVPTCVYEVAESVVRLLIPPASAKEIDFHLFVAPELPLWIVSDPLRLRQIMFNLLGNAIKFTANVPERRGRVVLRITPAQTQEGTAAFKIVVADNGIGIRSKAMEHLFVPFTQADNTTTRRFGGTGLGLSITKRLVEMMHGTIGVESTPNVATEFSVILPLKMASPGHALPDVINLSGVRVLAVVNDVMCAEVLQSYLVSAGAEVMVADDLEQAYRLVRQRDGWSVLLLDFSLMSRAAKNAEFLDLPWVQLGRWTGMDGSDISSPLVRAYPLLYHDLIQSVAIAAGKLSIKSAVDQSERRHRPRIQVPTVDEATATGKLVLLAEDNEINRDVIQQQLRLLGYASVAVADGETALKHWRSGRYAMLLTDCHMPKMDGFQLTAAIRSAEPDGAHFPIVVVTANAMKGEEERCLAYGIDGYLTKPLRLNELGAMMVRYLPQGNDKQAPASAAVENPDSNALPIWDAKMLAQLVGEQPQLHRRLLDKFQINADKQISTLLILADEGEAGLIADLAHKLKSAARSVGAMALGELCQQIEQAGRQNQVTLLCNYANQISAAYAAFKEHLQRHGAAPD